MNDQTKHDVDQILDVVDLERKRRGYYNSPAAAEVFYSHLKTAIDVRVPEFVRVAQLAEDRRSLNEKAISLSGGDSYLRKQFTTIVKIDGASDWVDALVVKIVYPMSPGSGVTWMEFNAESSVLKFLDDWFSKGLSRSVLVSRIDAKPEGVVRTDLVKFNAKLSSFNSSADLFDESFCRFRANLNYENAQVLGW